MWFLHGSMKIILLAERGKEKNETDNDYMKSNWIRNRLKVVFYLSLMKGKRRKRENCVILTNMFSSDRLANQQFKKIGINKFRNGCHNNWRFKSIQNRIKKDIRRDLKFSLLFFKTIIAKFYFAVIKSKTSVLRFDSVT